MTVQCEIDLGTCRDSMRRYARRSRTVSTRPSICIEDVRRRAPHGQGETTRWLSTDATPGAAAAAAVAALASFSECTCP